MRSVSDRLNDSHACEFRLSSVNVYTLVGRQRCGDVVTDTRRDSPIEYLPALRWIVSLKADGELSIGPYWWNVESLADDFCSSFKIFIIFQSDFPVEGSLKCYIDELPSRGIDAILHFKTFFGALNTLVQDEMNRLRLMNEGVVEKSWKRFDNPAG